MARKNLLRDLLTPSPEELASRPPAPAVDSGQLAESDRTPASAAGDTVDSRQLPTARRTPKGAIGAVSRSIADLKARALIELDPHLIDAGGLTDRLEHDEADHARLMESLRVHGQQVPILVRPNPVTPSRYQIVYGRRRVLALRDLGLPVKALVRELDETELVLAQGQENNVRRDLSFIEKANFARQMVEAGFERGLIQDALSVDKTVLSRMLSITDRVAAATIAAIGSAPSIGRDRWLAFAELYAAGSPDPEDARDILAIQGAEESDARFEVVLTWLRARAERAGGSSAGSERRAPLSLSALDGTPLAGISRGRHGLTLRLEASEAFQEWLVRNLAEIHGDWQAGRSRR